VYELPLMLLLYSSKNGLKIKALFKKISPDAVSGLVEMPGTWPGDLLEVIGVTVRPIMPGGQSHIRAIERAIGLHPLGVSRSTSGSVPLASDSPVVGVRSCAVAVPVREL